MLVKGYKQFCGVAKALDILGERWTLLVVRDLLLGPRRYTDLERALVGITPNLLSKRLRDLVANGVVSQRETRDYELTELGRSLEGVVLGLGAFGAQFMKRPEADERVDARWLMLSLKRRYQGSEQRGAVGMVFGEDAFSVEFGGREIRISDQPGDVDVTLSGQFSGWFPLLSRQSTLRELETSQLIVRRGLQRPAQALVKALGLRP